MDEGVTSALVRVCICASVQPVDENASHLRKHPSFATPTSPISLGQLHPPQSLGVIGRLSTASRRHESVMISLLVLHLLCWYLKLIRVWFLCCSAVCFLIQASVGASGHTPAGLTRWPRVTGCTAWPLLPPPDSWRGETQRHRSCQ